MLTADEAMSAGLVNKVVADVDLLGESMVLAEKLASQAPQALAETKRLLAKGPLGADSTRDSGKSFERLLNTPDAREGISAFLEKRPAKWEGA